MSLRKHPREKRIPEKKGFLRKYPREKHPQKNIPGKSIPEKADGSGESVGTVCFASSENFISQKQEIVFESQDRA